mgnify:CR=1 FL=1
MDKLPLERVTKYTAATSEIMEKLGHATHAELLRELHSSYPDLSATTVHRITTRMVERGELRLAPSGRENILRFDANAAPHDHFMCEVCGLLRDAMIGDQLRPLIEQSIGDGCAISGSLTVSGVCKECNKGGV